MRFFINSFSFLEWRVRLFFFNFYNPFFNAIVKEQNLDFKKIPILIINFNQLEYLRKLIIFLLKNDYQNIVIIDNNSTYPPLLDYYKTINDSITVEKMETNQGHRVFWQNKYLCKKYGKGYYVITDADIVPDDGCPEDFVLHFKKILDNNKEIIKVGFSLKIDDIPDSNIHKSKVINWEKQFWEKQDKNGNYISVIDTTFALYRPINQFKLDFFYDAIRTLQPFIAQHGGWYVDSRNLTDEQDYYRKTANTSSSWQVDEKGEIIEEMYQTIKSNN